MSLLLRWVLNSVALFVVAYVVDGIRVDSIVVLFIASAVLGLLNAIVRPVLFWLTLPITVLTLGLFVLVLNAIMLAATALLIPGFQIDTFFAAVVGALILSVMSFITNQIVKSREKSRD